MSESAHHRPMNYPNLARYQVRSFLGRITLRGWFWIVATAGCSWFWWKVLG